MLKRTGSSMTSPPWLVETLEVWDKGDGKSKTQTAERSEGVREEEEEEGVRRWRDTLRLETDAKLVFTWAWRGQRCRRAARWRGRCDRRQRGTWPFGGADGPRPMRWREPQRKPSDSCWHIPTFHSDWPKADGQINSIGMDQTYTYEQSRANEKNRE